jgi:hypothetical protein
MWYPADGLRLLVAGPPGGPLIQMAGSVPMHSIRPNLFRLSYLQNRLVPRWQWAQPYWQVEIQTQLLARLGYWTRIPQVPATTKKRQRIQFEYILRNP